MELAARPGIPLPEASMLVTRRRKRKRNSKSTKQRSANISTAEDGRAILDGVEEENILFTTNSFTLKLREHLGIGAE